MSKISCVLEFSIKDGQIDQFKTKAEDFIATVHKNEPNTLGYQWYLGEDGTRCLALHTPKRANGFCALPTNPDDLDY